jgi:hypothetical protein
VVNDINFGICDDTSYPHAYTDHIDNTKWIVPVFNSMQIDVLFIPVDKSLYITKSPGMMQSTCDAILVYEDNVVFVELKESGSPWISKAIEQLKITIEVFGKNHDLFSYKKRRAFAANKKASAYAYNLQDEMDDFKRLTGVRLIIEANTIII